jgi:succinylarginine dihydrolase
MPPRTYNFDGLVGPTHGYAGLSDGNLASMKHRGAPGNPRAAALQGLEKMRRVAELGGAQAILPPQPRPAVGWLRRLGFGGTDAAVLARCLSEAPELLQAASSASAMWTANAATVAPSSDTADGRVHLTVANLAAMMHRALEPETTARVLRSIFADANHFTVHDPLPAVPPFFDEGAANHTRLATSVGRVHLFGWGRPRPGARAHAPTRFPARQGEAASRAVARLHQLAPEEVCFWQQAPRGIDAGAFHTDVLAVGENTFLMAHVAAFTEPEARWEELRRRLGDELTLVVADDGELPLVEAVASYPFNSELVERDDGQLVVLAPREACESQAARGFLERVVDEARSVEAFEAIDVNASMNNGGGPACLRLRVRLEENEAARLRGRVTYTSELDGALRAWIEKHYRDRLVLEDLADPELLREVDTALDELTQLLDLGSVYPFQRLGHDRVGEPSTD